MVVRRLVELGGVVGACTNGGLYQPIHFASGKGHTSTVKCLVELGSVVDMRALQLAINFSYHEVEYALSLPPWRLHCVHLALIHAHVSNTPQPNATYYSIPCRTCSLHGISSLCIACPCT